jgi:hypothetical protein
MPKPQTVIQLVLAMPAAFVLGGASAGVAMILWAAVWWVW